MKIIGKLKCNYIFISISYFFYMFVIHALWIDYLLFYKYRQSREIKIL
jgi:hypothetical protein